MSVRPVAKAGAASLVSLLFSSVITSVIFLGWAHRESSNLTPDSGLGYQLGIVGTTCMAVLLLYPLRKHARFMQRLWPVRHWFRMHMMLGIIGPLAILYHCNFQTGDLNSAVALYCMLLVSASGLIGRYFYTKLHAGIYGKRLDGQNLLQRISSDQQALRQALPEDTAIRHQFDDLYSQLIPVSPGQIGWMNSLLFTPRKLFRARAFKRSVRYHSDPSVRAIWPTLKQPLNAYYTQLRRLAQLHTFERLFSWWHLLHLPIFILMVATLVVHIWAVHSY